MADDLNNVRAEEWRDIPGWEGLYQASSLGRVRSLDRIIEALSRWGTPVRYPRAGRILKFKSDKDGYLGCHLVRGNINKHVKAHQVVCAAFHGVAPIGRVVAHGDGVRTNNIPENLRWATQKENQADRELHGTAPRGANHPCAKLTLSDLKLLRSARGTEYDAIIAEERGMNICSVAQARLGYNWGSVDL